MASQLGPKWLNRVQQIAAPTHKGRLSRYALLAEQVNALEAGLDQGAVVMHVSAPWGMGCGLLPGVRGRGGCGDAEQFPH